MNITPFILFIILDGYNASHVITQEFNSAEACQVAERRLFIEKNKLSDQRFNNFDSLLAAYCVKK